MAKNKARVSVTKPGTVVLGVSTLGRLMKNPKAREAFGFLSKPPTTTVKSCCGKGTVSRVDYESIKQRVLGLDAERVEKFKALIPAKRLRVVSRIKGKVNSRIL